MEESLPEGWTKQMSSKHNQHYYYHAATGESRWERPTAIEASSESTATTKRKATSESEKNDEEVKSGGDAKRQREQPTESSVSTTHKVAIIVPFRDLHVEQNREAQLQQFFPYMTRYALPLQKPRI